MTIIRELGFPSRHRRRAERRPMLAGVVLSPFYFLLSFIDAYSRYVVHHKLLIELNGEAVAIELQAALEASPNSQPRVVHDHGSEFVNRDVAIIKAHNLIDIKRSRGIWNPTASSSASTVRFVPRATTSTTITICELKRSSPS